MKAGTTCGGLQHMSRLKDVPRVSYKYSRKTYYNSSSGCKLELDSHGKKV